MKTISTVFFLEAVAEALYLLAAPSFWDTLPMSCPSASSASPAAAAPASRVPCSGLTSGDHSSHGLLQHPSAVF